MEIYYKHYKQTLRVCLIEMGLLAVFYKIFCAVI